MRRPQRAACVRVSPSLVLVCYPQDTGLTTLQSNTATSDILTVQATSSVFAGNALLVDTQGSAGNVFQVSAAGSPLWEVRH